MACKPSSRSSGIKDKLKRKALGLASLLVHSRDDSVITQAAAPGEFIPCNMEKSKTVHPINPNTSPRQARRQVLTSTLPQGSVENKDSLTS